MGKKKHEHHGGAWKVAYADFVTAMMALFMVLWISAQDQEILLSTSRYFQNPFDSPLDKSAGIMTGSQAGSGSSNEGEKPPSNLVDMAFLNQLANEFYRLLNVPEASEDEKPIDISVTADGLRITIFDRQKQPFFKPGSAELTDWGGLIVQNMAWILDRNDMAVRIDSYAGNNFPGRNEDYSPWELASDRGNAMRRGLVHFALRPDKVERVTSFVHNPEGADAPDERSQRIELSLIAPK